MNKYMISAFLAAIFIGISIVFGAQAAKVINPLILACLASIISSIILYSFMKITSKKIQIIKSVKKFPKAIFSIIILRVLIGSILLMCGLRLTSAMKAGFMLRVEPLFVLIIAFLFLGQKIKFKNILMIIILLSGAFLLSTGGNIDLLASSQLGDVLIIMALIFFAYTYIPGKKLANSIGPLAVNIITNLIGGLILLAFILMIFPLNLFLLSNWAILMFIGYVVSFYIIGLTLWYNSLKKIKGWVVSYILSISALTSAVIAYLWLGQTLSHIQIIGAIIILISSIYISKKS